MQTPTVFISYSHDSDEHKNWVFQLASKLQANGVAVSLDRWDSAPGANLRDFMERGIRDSDRVLVVCTDQYNQKANDGRGGVGHEINIMTEELLSFQGIKKFIPCIRGVSTAIKTPTCLSRLVYIDFTNDAEFDANLELLLRNLHVSHSISKPPLGKSPFALPEKETLSSISGECSTVFFSKRFSDAFPGMRVTCPDNHRHTSLKYRAPAC